MKNNAPSIKEQLIDMAYEKVDDMLCELLEMTLRDYEHLKSDEEQDFEYWYVCERERLNLESEIVKHGWYDCRDWMWVL